MLRVIVLSIALMFSLGAIIPLATNYSEAGQKRKIAKKRTWNVKKYSKKWWSLYQAQERRKRAVAARKRSLRARQMLLAKQKAGTEDNNSEKVAESKSRPSVRQEPVALLPSGESAPRTWKSAQESKGELQFKVDDGGGKTIGTASISVVGPAASVNNPVGRNKTVGGISTSALRRTVIDQMMKEEGWVVNDYQKDINGRKVYIVVGQSVGAGGQLQSRTFYFTEVEGKIYSLATNTPNESSERLAQESEKVINSLQKSNRPVQQAGLR